jgi:hypothetical protein
VIQPAPDEFLVTGTDSRVVFHLFGKMPWMLREILSTEQGVDENGRMQFRAADEAVRVKMIRCWRSSNHMIIREMNLMGACCAPLKSEDRATWGGF